jgi:geranylgeranylglycerol-phosphate geranylgeranyltransferase
MWSPSPSGLQPHATPIHTQRGFHCIPHLTAGLCRALLQVRTPTRFLPARLAGGLRLVRLSNSLPAGALVLIGAYLAAGWPPPGRTWLAAFAMWCITAYGYASNDCFDLVEDSINKPDRPLPAGLVTLRGARQLALGLAAAALLCGLWLGVREAIVALLVLGLLSLYNVRLKGVPVAGNGLVALLAGATLLTGSVTVRGFGWPAISPVFVPATMLACFIAAREIIKTLEDVEGDQRAGKQTLATWLGATGTLVLVALLAVLVVGLSWVAVVRLGYSWGCLAVLGIGVHLPLVFSLAYLWRKTTPSRVSRCLALLKASYFAGILAFLVA